MKCEKTQKYVKLFQVTLAAACVYLVLKYLLPIVLPFVISGLLCLLFYPWAEKLSKKTRLPLVFWACILIGGFALLLAAAAGIILWYLGSQVQMVFRNSAEITLWCEQLWEKVCGLLAGISGSSSDDVAAWLCQWGTDFLENFQSTVPKIVADFGVGSVKWLGKVGIVILIAFMGAILLIKNKKRIHFQISRNIFAREITGIAGRICQVAASFCKCQAIIIGVISVILSVGLRLMGNRYGITIGVGVAFLDALPLIGSGTILVPWAVISFLNGRYKNAVVLVILYVLCLTVREMLEPRLMGDKLGINEFYMLMATFIGITLFGVWGIFLGPLGMIMILEILKQMEDLYEREE